MPWAKFDDRFNSHPKVLAAGPLAVALHMRAIIYSAQYMTDGVIRRRTINHILNWDDDEPDFSGGLPSNRELAKRLVNAKLWDEAPDGEGWVIHDYLDYNPSREELERLQRQRVEAGRAGGRAKASRRNAQSAGTNDPPGDAERPSEPLASARPSLAFASASLEAEPPPSRSPEPEAPPIPLPPPSPEPPPKRGPPTPSLETGGIVGYRADDASDSLASASDSLGDSLDEPLGCRQAVATDASLAKRYPEPDPLLPSTIKETPVRSNAAEPSGLRPEVATSVVGIPLVHGEYRVTMGEVSEWGKAYPGVDVRRELEAMRQWCLSNPRKRKNETGVRRFITGWLAREQRAPRPSQRGRGRRQSFADVTRAAMEWASGQDEEDRVRSADD